MQKQWRNIYFFRDFNITQYDQNDYLNIENIFFYFL